jgi:hypothetical protein
MRQHPARRPFRPETHFKRLGGLTAGKKKKNGDKLTHEPEENAPVTPVICSIHG